MIHEDTGEFDLATLQPIDAAPCHFQDNPDFVYGEAIILQPADDEPQSLWARLWARLVSLLTVKS